MRAQASFEPRKTPIQARSTVTVEAIWEATIQVLLEVGPDRLTTTRVAERAGVSVGTLYQYFPNKHSLLFSVAERHLNRVADAVERAARKLCRGNYVPAYARSAAGAPHRRPAALRSSSISGQLTP